MTIGVRAVGAFTQTPSRPEAEGYNISVAGVWYRALRRVIGEFMDRGRVDHLQSEMMTFDEIKETLGLQNVMDLRRRLESL